MPDQTVALGERAIADDAVELPWYTALVSGVAYQVALVLVRPGAAIALPLAAGVAYLTADGLKMAFQGEDVGQALTTARAHVGFVGLRFQNRRRHGQLLRVLSQERRARKGNDRVVTKRAGGKMLGRR